MKSPFKFLDSYTREDREIFFGREREIEELYQKVFERRILLLYGISGTGKTSLINCGLANKFEETDWLPINIRRGKNINESLIEEVNKEAILPLKKGATITKIIQSVYLDHFKPVYLIFDQFEELFIFGKRNEREVFIQTISEIVNSDIQCKCLFSIREEYLAGVTEFEGIIPEFLANRMRVEKMTLKNAKDVIEGPCQVNGIVVEKGFADALLQKLNPDTNEIELTYLQVFLDKIFKVSGDKEEFTVKLIGDVGNVSDLLGSFLEEQIGELDDPDTGLVVLKAFVSMQGTKKQIGEEEISDFAHTLGKPIELEKLTDLLQRFINLRVLKDKDEHNQYELRHDSLAVKIYEKITLIEKELLEVKDFLKNAFSNHERRGIYLNEADLTYIAPYEDKIFLNKKLQQFLTDSKNEIAKYQRRKRRMIAAAAALLITILTFFTAWAIQERGKAVDQSRIAEEKRKEALTARDQAIQAQEEADRSRSEAERLREEAEAAKDDALMQKQLTDSALVVAEYQRNISEEQRQRAENLFEEANEQRQIAQIAQQSAEKSADEVEEASRDAMLQLYLYNAQEFASKSLLTEEDDTLKAILALSAIDLVNYGYKHYSDIGGIITYDIRFVEALQKASLRLDDNTLYSGRYWALDIKQEIVAISDEKNQILLARFEDLDPYKFPSFVGKKRMDLNQRIDADLDGTVSFLDDDSFIRTISIDASNERIVFSNSDGRVSLININGIETTELYSHKSTILSVTVAPWNNRVISTATDQSFIAYDIVDESILFESILPSNAFDLTLSGEKDVVFHDKMGMIYVLDILNDENPRIVHSINRPIESFAVCNSLNRMAIVGSGSLLLLQLNQDGSVMNTIESALPHSGMISEMAFSPDGKWLVMGGFDGIISLWDLSSPQLFEKDQINPILHRTGLKIVKLLFDTEGKYLIYSDLKRILLYPVDMDNMINKLSVKLKGKRLSDNEWSTFVKGELKRPDIDYCANEKDENN